MKCEREHKKHKIINYGDILPNQINKIEEFREYINKLKNEINNIIDKLKYIITNIEIYYKISNKIINGNYKKGTNYQNLKNINEFNEFNNIIINNINNITNDTIISSKFKKLMNIYDKISNNNFESIKNEKNEIIEKDKKDKEDIKYNMNYKEIFKLKLIFFNSFIRELETDKEDIIKIYNEKENNIINVENDLQYYEGFNENNENKEKGQKKRYEDIFKFRQDLKLKNNLKKFNLFYYTCKNSNEDKIIYKLGKALVYTCMNNLPKIKNYKTNKIYTTDAWWGCMIRCGQMILSRGIYRLLKSKGLDTKKALFFTVSLFSNYPIRKGNLHPFFDGMIKKYKDHLKIDDFQEKDIKPFYPPFSIKTLCDVGELFETTGGEWFNEVIIIEIFRKISEYYDLFNHPKLKVKIMNYKSCIELQDILDKCFISKKYDKNNDDYMHIGDKYYYFDKMGIVFINISLGKDKIPKDYYSGIKKLFTLKECLAIISGKPTLAYYFIGYNHEEDSLLYLDPHVTKEAYKVINMGNILSNHVNKEIHLLKLNKMNPSFTIGFSFRNYEEFLDIYGFWLRIKQDNLPLFEMIKSSNV